MGDPGGPVESTRGGKVDVGAHAECRARSTRSGNRAARAGSREGGGPCSQHEGTLCDHERGRHDERHDVTALRSGLTVEGHQPPVQCYWCDWWGT